MDSARGGFRVSQKRQIRTKERKKRMKKDIGGDELHRSHQHRTPVLFALKNGETTPGFQEGGVGGEGE